MRKLILSIAAAAPAAASVISLAPASAHDHGRHILKLTTKTLAETPQNGPPSLRDVNVITEDAFRGGKQVGTPRSSPRARSPRRAM